METNKNCIYKEIRNCLNSGNSSHSALQKRLALRLLYYDFKIYIFTYSCDLVSHDVQNTNYVRAQGAEGSF